MQQRVKELIAGSQLTTSAATYYTAPANTYAVIAQLTLTNTSANAVTATVHRVPSGGTASDSNKFVSARTLAPGETYVVNAAIGRRLNPGSFIDAQASAATSITIMMDG